MGRAMKRVVLSGIGVVAPNGVGKEPFWANSLAGRSCLSRIDGFDASEYSCQVAGQVRDFAADQYVDKRIRNQTDRSTHMALASCALATEDARLDLSRESPTEVGMYFANIFGGM